MQLSGPRERVDNAIHWINRYPVDSVVFFLNTYPLLTIYPVDNVIHSSNNRGLAVNYQKTVSKLWCYSLFIGWSIGDSIILPIPQLNKMLVVCDSWNNESFSID